MIEDIDFPEEEAASFKAASRVGSDGKLRMSFGLGFDKGSFEFILLTLKRGYAIGNKNLSHAIYRYPAMVS
jgi:hypothetical protein